MKSRTFFAALLATAALGSTAFAHTIHLDTRQSPAAIVLAHDGAFEPVAGVRVTGAEMVSARGVAAPLIVARQERSSAATIPTGTRAVLIRYSGVNGGQAPDGTRRVGSRTANPDVAEVSRSEIETLAILASGARVSALSASPLRLEPVGEVHNMRAGTMITVRATLRGQPLAGAPIRLQAAASDTGGATATTGADGTARLAIPDAGVNLFALNHVDRAANDPDAHVIRRQASLSFTALPARTGQRP